MNAITVVTLANDAYSLPLAVMVRSLLETLSPERNLQLAVIDGGISAANRQRLELSWRDTPAWPRCEVRFVPPVYGSSRLPVWGRVPSLTYARISVADYLPAGVTRAIVLDSDMLVLADARRLAGENLDGRIAGAAIDPFIPRVSSLDGLSNYTDLGMKADDPYFNAGAMVLDIAAWRRERVAERAFEFIERHGDRLCQYDQDSLNAVLHGQWRQIDSGWNMNPRTRNSLGAGETAVEPKIFHFSGRLKPWTYRPSTAADRLFYEVQDRTDWRGWRPPATIASLLLRVYDSPIRTLAYPLERNLNTWQRRLIRWRHGDR